MEPKAIGRPTGRIFNCDDRTKSPLVFPGLGQARDDKFAGCGLLKIRAASLGHEPCLAD
jgi:hypothetical protein